MIRRLCCWSMALALLPAAEACEGLQVQQPWIREAPPGAPAMAGYARLINQGSKPLQVSAVSSADFERTEIHESRMVDGQMRMRRIDPITLAPGQSLDLQAGGKHLMLMQPKASFSGTATRIEWQCGEQKLHTAFPVRKAP